MNNNIIYAATFVLAFIVWAWMIFAWILAIFEVEMSTEKQDLRVKINNETHKLLDAYCEQSGTTKGQVVSDLIWGSIPSRLACAQHILTNMYNNNICSTPDISEVKTKTRGKRLLPADFSPSRSIAEDAGIDYDGALEAFSDWAKAVVRDTLIGMQLFVTHARHG